MRLLLVATIADTLRGFFLPFARHFRAKGWRVDGLAKGISACPECRKAFDHVTDIDWSRKPQDPRNLLSAPNLIRKTVQERRYEIVHVSTPVASFVTRFALRNLRKEGGPKIIYTAHGFLFYEGGSCWRNSIHLALERVAARWTDYLTVMNTDDVRMTSRYGLFPPHRAIYIPGVGIDRAKYSPAAISPDAVNRVRDSLGLSTEQPLLLMVAEFIPRKRHADALRAFSMLRHRSARLAFAGDGPLLQPMKQLAAKLRIDDRTIFLGERRDIRECIRASAATILPSEREGLPRSIMESLSLCVPVIGSNIRGNKDLLSGGGGLLIPVGDVKGLTAAMSWIVNHRPEACAMGEIGRQRLAGFDLDNVLRMHEELYERAVGPKVDRRRDFMTV
jgi:glycosyltransferase involved in cell wall biosynthesis